MYGRLTVMDELPLAAQIYGIIQPMTSALIAARYISDRYRREKHADIDQMKLHKLLYLVQRESLVQHDEPLFAENIYAFQYGPVVKEVRDALRNGNMANVLPRAEFPDGGKSIVDIVFDTYSDKNSWSLSRLTHAEYSWCHARRASNSGGGERLMPVDDIRQDAARIRTRRALRQALVRSSRRCKKP